MIYEKIQNGVCSSNYLGTKEIHNMREFMREVSLILSPKEIQHLCCLISLKAKDADLGQAERERQSRTGKVGPTDVPPLPFSEK